MKVLVVDDDVVSRMVLMHLVDSCGAYDIHEAEDGLDAWRQLQQGLRPAICFCDLRMPRWSGMELLESVKADRAFDAMRFILASSASDGATMAMASSLGADGYIVKPFEHAMVRARMVDLAAGANDAERPAATLARLCIGSERLLAYLGGFDTQLEAAVSALDAAMAAGGGGGAGADMHARLLRLHAGCVTLGLTGPAAGLGALAIGVLATGALTSNSPDAMRVQAALAAALATLRQQAERVRRMPVTP